VALGGRAAPGGSHTATELTDRDIACPPARLACVPADRQRNLCDVTRAAHKRALRFLDISPDRSIEITIGYVASITIDGETPSIWRPVQDQFLRNSQLAAPVH
jgi:hypothetical protein